MTGNSLRFVLAYAVVSLTILSVISPTHATVHFQTIALTGKQVPGATAGVTFKSFTDSNEPPTINNHGQVAFLGLIEGPGVDYSNNTGIWSTRTGSLELVAREGDAVTQTDPGVTYSGFNTPKLFDSGQIIYRANLSGDSITNDNDTSYWIDDQASSILILREGSQAPGLETGVVFTGLSTSLITNSKGQFAFRAGMTGSTTSDNDVGIWVGDRDSIRLVAREGDQAPGTEPGTKFKYFRSLRLNDKGHLAFSSYLDTGTDFNYSSSIWIDRDGDTSLIAQSGDPATGLGPDIVNRPDVSHIGLSDSGHISYISHLYGPGIDDYNNQVIWLSYNDSTQLIARIGENVTGTGPDHFTWFSFAQPTAAGEVIFGADKQTGWVYDHEEGWIVPVSSRGLWITSNGSPEQIALEDTDGLNYIYNLQYNQSGQLAISTGSSLWIAGPNTPLERLVGPGDLFDVNDDPAIEDLRIVSLASTDYVLNETGQVSFFLDFEDGSSGIFVATIPEPGTVALFIVGVGLMLRRRFY